MAVKRMFSNKVLDTDAFLEMPLSAQALYFHLNLRADDDGFIGNPKRITRFIGASDDDLKLLVLKRFLIAFDDGVVVVKHWRMHNTIRKDRYTQTAYIEDLAMLGIKDNEAYTTNGNQMATKWQPTVTTDIDIGIDKDIDIDIESITPPAEATPAKPQKHKYGEANNVLLTDAELAKLKEKFPNSWENKINNLSTAIAIHGYKYKDHYRVILKWAEKDDKKPQASKNKFNNIDQREYDFATLEKQLLGVL